MSVLVERSVTSVVVVVGVSLGVGSLLSMCPWRFCVTRTAAGVATVIGITIITVTTAGTDESSSVGVSVGDSLAIGVVVGVSVLVPNVGSNTNIGTCMRSRIRHRRLNGDGLACPGSCRA